MNGRARAADDSAATQVRLAAGTIGAAVLAVLSASVVIGNPPEPRTGGVLALELVVVAAALFANRRGATTAAGRLLAFSLPVLSAALMVLSGQGLRDVVALALPSGLVLCGVLLDRRALFAVSALTIACVVLVLVLEGSGVRVPSPPDTDVLADALDATAILSLTGLGVSRLVLRLRLSEARYRALVEFAADAILLVSPDGSVLQGNERACDLTGYARAELIGQPLERLVASGGPEESDPLLCEGRVALRERQLTRRDGTRLPVEASTRRMPDGSCQAILRDLTPRRRAEAERLALEQQLEQARKLEAVGRLASGVAHDFNNLLSAITGSVTMALRETAPGAGSRRWLGEIEKAAWRAASLTRQLLAFSRQQAFAPRVVDLRDVVAQALRALAPLAGERVALRHHAPGEPCHASVDPAQVEQVILNLAANARDAMPDGGTLSLAVARDEAAGTVQVDVEDTGEGMSDAVRERLFEPFFTTRKRSGLGLAMAYGIVEQHGGRIVVSSEPAGGSRFRLVFPDADRPAAC